MRKVFLTMMAVTTALLLSQGANAQITLEKTFEGNVEHIGTPYSPFQDYYTYLDAETSEVRLYNEDYSLYKTVKITPPAKYSLQYVSLFSKNVFTNNDVITFVGQFNSTAADVPDRNLAQNYKLYDENGTMLKDLGYAFTFFSPTIHVTPDNKFRLIVLSYVSVSPLRYKTEIYSVPGTVPTDLRSAQVENPKQLPYPNPANTIITLPYKLEQGETSVMNIYNINGQLIDAKQIDFVFDRILLNVSGYAKGVYLYEVKGVSNRFIVE